MKLFIWAEIVAEKRKVRIQQYTRYALIAANRASAVDHLTSGEAHQHLYACHRIFQSYHWLSRKLWNKLACSRLARNLNTTIYNKREASRKMRRGLR
uniref:Uncharacterized protein n=1 Tax=Rhipicephalus zambeziensis TaxID=60191 RepID=A0A224Y6G6_9ACAR